MKYAIVILSLFVACKSSNKISGEAKDSGNSETPGPRAYIYLTNGDYDSLVPVLMNEEGTEIVSYPHPTDLKGENGFLLPGILSRGYRLDNRGINLNVAFLRLTYEEYSKLDHAPSLTELYDLILDKDPLAELCDCGMKKDFKDIETQINLWIENGQLRKRCKVIR